MSQLQKPSNGTETARNQHLSTVSNERIKHTILVVDDEENNLQLLKRTLRRKYNIITATNGLEALKMLKRMVIILL